jgi:hypothetical protein
MLKNRTFSSPDAPGRYVYTGDFRAPKKGEFYLSGAKVSAYRAPNDLTQKFHIARLVPGTLKGKPQ